MNEWISEWMTDAETHGNTIENTVMLWKFRHLAKETREEQKWKSVW